MEAPRRLQHLYLASGKVHATLPCFDLESIQSVPNQPPKGALHIPSSDGNPSPAFKASQRALATCLLPSCSASALVIIRLRLVA